MILPVFLKEKMGNQLPKRFLLMKKWKNSLANIFKDIRYERSLVFSLSSTDPDVMEQSGFRDQEIKITKTLH